MSRLGEIDLKEAELHVIVDVVAVYVVGGRDDIAAGVGQAGLDHINVLQLRLDLRFAVAPQGDHDIGIQIGGQIEGVPADANLAGIALVHIVGGKKDLLGGGGRCLHEVLSAPLEALRAHGDLEADVALGLEEGLHANHTIAIYIGAQHRLRVEVAGNAYVRVKAGSRYVHHLPAQHVA